ncbi:DUF1523 family protein [Campylobacter sp. faydin G-105]|uniref:DUF1523 family protein n=1 Tax=Campylobacter anatolicus TaxID=2829105 RepID=UPI001B90A44C|nr:DUF1523 family protein [Campylobacter anatolicus]MBR8461985.1 DUF1523 family protein [Campylobacter anatolicus]
MSLKDKILSVSKRVIIVIAVLLHLMLLAVVNFITPHYEITKVNGVEVKRVDKDGPITKANPADGPTRDVYQINTQKPGSTDVMVYRNEDTRWSFPFYFKFGSADLQAMAQGFANSDSMVVVKYYGWRIVIFDEFRNALTIKEAVSPESEPLPVLSYVLYVLVFISLVLSLRRIGRIFSPKTEKI